MIDQEDMQALLASTTDKRIRVPAAAWLTAWRHARWLAFNETVALRQADAAWDRAAQNVATARRCHRRQKPQQPAIRRRFQPLEDQADRLDGRFLRSLHRNQYPVRPPKIPDAARGVRFRCGIQEHYVCRAFLGDAQPRNQQAAALNDVGQVLGLVEVLDAHRAALQRDLSTEVPDGCAAAHATLRMEHRERRGPARCGADLTSPRSILQRHRVHRF
jgi:hypothetical protein